MRRTTYGGLEHPWASRWVRWAVQRKVLVRPASCDRCGSTPRPQRIKAGVRRAYVRTAIQAHHLDYRDIRKVEWLCPACADRYRAAGDCAPRDPHGDEGERQQFDAIQEAAREGCEVWELYDDDPDEYEMAHGGPW